MDGLAPLLQEAIRVQKAPPKAKASVGLWFCSRGTPLHFVEASGVLRSGHGRRNTASG